MSKVTDGIMTDLKQIPSMLQEKVKGCDMKKMLLMNMPYLLAGYFCNLLAGAYRDCAGSDMSETMTAFMEQLGHIFEKPLPSLYPADILFGLAGGAGLKLFVMYKAKNAKKFRPGTEFGSARWGCPKDIEPYMSAKPEENIPLTQTEGIMMSCRPKNPKYARNKNILVIGGSGSGKTRFFVKLSLMQMNCSYVVTDPKSTLLYETGQMLVNGGYEVKFLNTINFKKSMHYNPFRYIRSEKDILKLVNTIMINTKGSGAQASEDFWTKAERLLFMAYIGYIWYVAVEEEQNFSTLLDMINASETREEDETFKNAVDLMFEELEAEQPEHFAVRQYRKYKLAAGNIKFRGHLNQAI